MSKLRRLLVSPYPRDPPGQGVYEAKCKDCDKVYIGETGLRMETRIKTHSKGINSAIRKHAHARKACEEAFDFAMIRRCHNKNLRKIVEAAEIKKRTGLLNENKGVDSYLFVGRILFRLLTQ